MIRTENYTRNDGVILIRTYSDENYMIRQNETLLLIAVFRKTNFLQQWQKLLG